MLTSVFVLQEKELKMAADSVLCEVRKKQADVKRMQDILRSLEKLRRLRREAVSKKGGSRCCIELDALSEWTLSGCSKPESFLLIYAGVFNALVLNGLCRLHHGYSWTIFPCLKNI